MLNSLFIILGKLQVCLYWKQDLGEMHCYVKGLQQPVVRQTCHNNDKNHKSLSILLNVGHMLCVLLLLLLKSFNINTIADVPILPSFGHLHPLPPPPPVAFTTMLSVSMGMHIHSLANYFILLSSHSTPLPSGTHQSVPCFWLHFVHQFILFNSHNYPACLVVLPSCSCSGDFTGRV